MGVEAPFLKPPPLGALPSEVPCPSGVHLFEECGFWDPQPPGNSTQRGQPFPSRHTDERSAKPGFRPALVTPVHPPRAPGSLYVTQRAPPQWLSREGTPVLDPQAGAFPRLCWPAWPSPSRWHLAGWAAAAIGGRAVGEGSQAPLVTAEGSCCW